jgi:hypothetical protein
VDAIDVSDHSRPPGHRTIAAPSRECRAPCIHDTHSPAYRCSASSSAVCSSSSSSGYGCSSSSARTPAPLFWSFYLSIQASHPGFLDLGHRTRQRSATSSTSICCNHCCCGYVHDCSSSGGSCTVAYVSQYQLQLLLQILDPRLTPIHSLSLHFCLDRDLMRLRLLPPLLVCRFG